MWAFQLSGHFTYPVWQRSAGGQRGPDNRGCTVYGSYCRIHTRIATHSSVREFVFRLHAITRSFVAFGGSYAPIYTDRHISCSIANMTNQTIALQSTYPAQCICILQQSAQR